MVDKLKVGSLFSGYGGLDLAVMNVCDVKPEWLGEGGENDRWGPGEHDMEAVFLIPIQEMRAL